MREVALAADEDTRLETVREGMSHLAQQIVHALRGLQQAQHYYPRG